MTLEETMLDLGRAAREGADALRQAAPEQRTAAILAMASRLRAHSPAILAANARDLAAATRHQDRLMLDASRVEAIAAGLDQVASLPDPLGTEIARGKKRRG